MKNILLVFGGKSYEHDISVVTASQIYNKTKIQDVNLVPFYVSRDGEYFIYESKKFVLSDFSKKNFNKNNKNFKQVCFVSGENNKIFVRSFMGLKEYMESEFAIFACHGASGENGKLVSIFESINIFSSAGNFDALALCMNKFIFKQVMKGLKIPTVQGFKVTENELSRDYEKILNKAKKLKFPVVIKSNTGGSSIGLFVSNNEQDFMDDLTSAFEFDSEVIIEKFIDNTREFNVAVLGCYEKYEVSAVDEPIKTHEILSFADKYLSGAKSKSNKFTPTKSNSMASQLRNFPACISEELKLKLQNYAEKIFVNLGLSGVVRIDFLYDEQNDKVYVCEVNAIPGSLAYYFFNGNNILANNLTLKLIETAEWNKKKALKFREEYSTSILDSKSL